MQSDGKALVLGATDIVELIGQTVALKRAGKDYVGLCPFHQEKTPSFHVSHARQFYYCFGCKAGGNAIDFVIKTDRVEFKDALEILARRAGIELPKTGRSDEKPGERQLLFEANAAAAKFFENSLSGDQGAAAREYLAKRGFTPETIRKFQIGLAVDSWNALLTGPVGSKFGPPLLAKAGLIKVNDTGRAYDTFRNRVMFPIRDDQGRIIAFGGRIMPGSEDPAKYLNSPETPLFSKGRAIYALDHAKQRIVETRIVACCEGYTDAVMAHQFGASNVVSILGTAMTEQHVNVLRRFADRIVLLFDPDTAGELAVNRVVQLFLTQPVEIGVASIPDGMDPDEYLLARGVKEFEQLLSTATDALTYAWKQVSRQFNAAADLTGRQKITEQYLQMIADARGSAQVDALRWGAVLVRLSRLTEIPVEQLQQRFRGRPAGPRPAQRPAPSAQPAAAEQSASPAAAERPALSLAQEQAERWLLGALLAEPGRWHDVQVAVGVEEFLDPTRQKLAKTYWEHQRDEGEPVFSELLSTLAEPGLGQLAIELVEEAERLADLNQAVMSAMKHFADVRRKREERTIAAQLMASKDQPLAEQDELALLRKITEAAKKPDPGRLGPRAG